MSGVSFLMSCEKEQKEKESEAVSKARPCLCLDVYDPVCGCDGHTYGNACYAACAGVSVMKPGLCGEKCEPKFRPDCYCPAVYKPVCGCDGTTYGNSCEAACMSVEVAGPGPCGKICGGLDIK